MNPALVNVDDVTFSIGQTYMNPALVNVADAMFSIGQTYTIPGQVASPNSLV